MAGIMPSMETPPAGGRVGPNMSYVFMPLGGRTGIQPVGGDGPTTFVVRRWNPATEQWEAIPS